MNIRIKTQFIASAAIFGVILLIFSVLLVNTGHRLQAFSEQESLARRLQQDANELGFLSNAYLLFPEEAQITLWRSKMESISAGLSALELSESRQRNLAADIGANHQRLETIFAEIRANLENRTAAADDPEYIRTSWSRLQIQSQGIIAQSAQLSQLLRDQFNRIEQTHNLIIAVLFSVFGVLILVNYILINRRVVNALSALQAGTGLIGSGNLDYTIPEQRQDEFGDLSRAFNRMTSSLKTVTASKKDLETEVGERRKAEEALLESNERLKILSEANSLLLSSEDPENIVQAIAGRVMAHLKCDCFFNFIFDESAGKLRLNAYAGIPEETARGIEWLDLGEAISGCAARDGCRIVSENIRENGDMRAALVRSFGIQAYAAHPLAAGLKTVGTLSFGTRSCTAFTEDELDLMKTIAGQVSIAMERKQTERSLKRYTAELEAANKELEAFSYSVSHDLRQPLRALDGFSLAVLENLGDKLDKTNRDYLKRVRKASQTMGLLIEDLLKLSRISRAEMRFNPVNLSEVADFIVGELKQGQPERRIEFTLTPELCVRGDKPLLTIALRNLLENAWKYSRDRSQTRIEMGTVLANGETAFFIRDNGVGFDMKYYDKLFHPFQRLHSAAEYEGTGIGLATVQRIIRRHGGRVWAESEAGKGTIIYFTVGKG